ncbi:hypothetical protein CPT_Sonora_069 [Stenotrophomonas phage Sonora]|nr:hypothetical protein CPT_Sonora_069 [Stenotrophomonas phage Sonora]
MNNLKPIAGRADFSVPEPTLPDGPAGCKPLEAPDPATVNRMRQAVEVYKSVYLTKQNVADDESTVLRALAARLRAEHLFNGPVDYAMIRCADLDLILAFVEEKTCPST